MNILSKLISKITGAPPTEDPSASATPAKEEKPKIDIKKAIEPQTFILSITRTNVFLKMSPQDKITSLTKLITLFEQDFGYKPKKLEKALLELSGNLILDIKKAWDEEYSKGKGTKTNP